MKGILRYTIIFFVSLFSVSVFATDDLTLVNPAPLCPPNAYTVKIRSYVIVPPPDGKIEVHYNLCDADGAVFAQDKVVIDGSDYTDVVGFTIRTEDVGTKIGAGLKLLIWNKLESKFSIEFE